MEVQSWFTNLTADYKNMIDIVRHTDFSKCAYAPIKGDIVNTDTTVILGSQIVEGKTFTHFVSNAWVKPVYFVGRVLGPQDSQRKVNDNVPHVRVILDEEEREVSLDTLYRYHPASKDRYPYMVTERMLEHLDGIYSDGATSSEDETPPRTVRAGDFYSKMYVFSLHCPVAEEPVFTFVDSHFGSAPWLSGRDRDGVYCARDTIKGVERVVTLGQFSIYRSLQEIPSFVTKDCRGAGPAFYHGKSVEDCACCTQVGGELPLLPTIEVSKRKHDDPDGLYHVWVRVKRSAVVAKSSGVFPYDTDNMPPLSEQQFDPLAMFGVEPPQESDEEPPQGSEDSSEEFENVN